ncbi:hypothetical protein ACFL0V_00395 [Nanoarchaeota archaeon]
MSNNELAYLPGMDLLVGREVPLIGKPPSDELDTVMLDLEAIRLPEELSDKYGPGFDELCNALEGDRSQVGVGVAKVLAYYIALGYDQKTGAVDFPKATGMVSYLGEKGRTYVPSRNGDIVGGEIN